MLTRANTLLLQPTLITQTTLKLILTIRTHTLQSTALMLLMMLAFMSNLTIRLANTGMTETVVNLLGRGAAESRTRGRLDSFLAMRALDVRV